MEDQGWKKCRVSGGIVLILTVFLLAGCGVTTRAADAAGDNGQESVKKGDYVEKEIIRKEGPLRDNDAIYADDDEDSVVAMYLTVREGNSADNTDHTWTEINSYSAYYYEDNGLERYNCEAILQVGDEDGPLEGEFGYGETVPNAAVQIRGQTSSKSKQKNYKIRIKEGKGEWRGQRTLALNKHVSDSVRFRNKLAYDFIKKIPQMLSARTQFVHLYVKDETTGGSNTFTDYGLYTQVEQVNKTYLKNHGLDNRGYLYKINFFEWYKYEPVMKLKSDSDYNVKEFEEYLEIKGSDNHEKLHDILGAVNDYTIPIQEIVEEYFDVENICYWIAFQLLIGNYDVGSRNLYIYSPLNSEKWYFISWDNDASFSRTYYSTTNYAEGQSWEQGITQFTHIVLFNRMFREEEYRNALSSAIVDIKENYLTYDKADSMIHSYAAVVKPFVYRTPDSEYARVSEDEYDVFVDAMASEIDVNYQYYLDSLKKPWPFFVGTPEVSDGKLTIQWDASYDLDHEDITYSFILASDNKFKNVLVEKDGIRIPMIECDILPPGEYFIRVRAKNESGYEQDCYDYLSTSEGKIYGAKNFIINEDGAIVESKDTNAGEAEGIEEIEEE